MLTKDNRFRSPMRFGRLDSLLVPTLLALIAVAILIRLTGRDYLASIAFTFFTFVAMAVSYDIFTGYTGYYNLGYGAFFGAGAYAFALSFKAGYGLLVAVALGGLIGAMFAAAVTVPLFRLRGAYFAIGTFGLVQLILLLSINLDNITNGLPGIHIALTEEAILIAYVSSVLLALVSITIHHRIGRSRLGLALRTLREDEAVAKSFGVDTFRAKAIVMVISGGLAGVIGSVFVINVRFINPTFVLGLEISLAPVVMAILGGSGLYLGPLLGAVILSVIREAIFTSIQAFQLLTFGAILIFVGLFMPGGLVRSRLLRGILKTAHL